MNKKKVPAKMRPLSFWFCFTILLSSYIDAVTDFYNLVEANILSTLLVYLCYYHFEVCEGRWH